MKMKKLNVSKITFSPKSVVIALLTGALLSPWTLAAGNHGGGHHANEDNTSGHMMGTQQMGQHMREVNGHGRINKVMKDKKMLNISHEPISELNWPKMRMNFQTSDQVKLNNLKPGDEVSFILQVDEENNYLIKHIEAK